MFIFRIIIVSLLICFGYSSSSQGFLHADGKNIVNGAGENVILRGIGTGNWMLMEGYMMKTEGIAGTQHEFEAKLIETIGEEKTKTFFDTWLANHFTKTDVDSMKAWGFNSVRVAMHYKWFTLPVEKELNPGSNTWLLKGFRMIDNLLEWCGENEMYLILDLHAAPGGQGKNADISDYDPSKPSLWESQANKDKTVALWKMLASRYSKKSWIGGYDLINETNWTFPEGNNSQMRELFGRITDAIREVDKNHIIFIEGNSYANDHSGLTPPWDDNLVYSFHKYWSGTSSSDLDWIKALRDEYDVPLWMGESGENSNTWYTDFVHLCESNNIGWSWWPVKKNSINNVLNVPINKEYENLIKYWRGEISIKPSETKAFNAVMQWAENHKIENCKVQYDVIDALIRQPHTNEILPYKENKLREPIYFSDFDLGKNGIAYLDNDVANYGGEWTAWNTGWELRNDGVDIEKCRDLGDVTNGYNVGWTETGEWMQYSLKSDSTAIYKLTVRHASGASGSKFRIKVNGADVSGELSLPKTGGWQNWQTATFNDIIVPAGNIKIKYINTKGGSNLSYFKFSEPKSAKNTDFEALAAITSAKGSQIFISCNKDITSSEFKSSDFQLLRNGSPIDISLVTKDSSQSSVLILEIDAEIFSDNNLTLSYTGSSVTSGEQLLKDFSNLEIENNLPVTHLVPGKIEAEDFYFNNGLSLEQCSDQNGGLNTGHSAAGEYLDYHVHVTKTGIYSLNYRVATEHSDAGVVLQVGDGESFSSIDTMMFKKTNGWQSWESQSSTVRLEEGYYFIRVLIKQGEHNLNWFNFDLVTSTEKVLQKNDIVIYPNPAKEKLTVAFSERQYKPLTLKIINMQGSIVKQSTVQYERTVVVDLEGLQNGIYILQTAGGDMHKGKRFIISR